MPISFEVFVVTGSTVEDKRWGQLLTLPTTIAAVEVLRPFGGAKEEGLRILTRLNRSLDRPLMAHDLQTISKEIGSSELVSLLIFSVRDSECLLWIRGEGKIFIRRGKVFAPLLQNEGFLSGEVKNNDILLFLSVTAATVLAGEEQSLFSENLSAKEMADAISIRLSQTGAKGEGAVVGVVKFLKTEPAVYLPQKTTPAHFTFIPSIKAWLQPKKNRWSVVIALLTLFFIGSVYMGIRKQQGDTSYQNLIAAVTEAKTLYDEGLALMESQPIKSREDFDKAQTLLAPYIAHPPKGKEKKTVETLSQQIHDNLQLVAKVYHKDPQLFFDASFLQKDRQISLFAVNDQSLAFADTVHGTIGVVDILSKDAKVVAGGSDFMITKFLVWNGTQLLIIKNGGVDALSPGAEEPKHVISSTDSWDTVSTFGGNFYAASHSTNELWRYPAGDAGGFGPSEAYFSEDSPADITKTSGMSIDGSIWFGSTIGKIYRFTQGRDDPFLVRGVDPSFGQHLEIATNPDINQVYIFDPENRRVVALSKEGVYQLQFVWPNTFSPTAFDVSFIKQKLFLLADQKLYSFGIE